VATLRSLDLSGVVHLPVGLWVDGTRQQDASIHDLTGHDEEMTGDASRWPSPAARVSALLAATVSRIGCLVPVDLDQVRALTVLDRDILLMALRQRLFGDRIQSTVRCPNGNCGKLVDIEFRLGDLPLPERSDSDPRYAFEVDGKMVTYRLPNGWDQESVAEIARGDPTLAGQYILRRCIDDPEELSAEQLDRLGKVMASRDPQLDTDFDAHCPECGQDFMVHFDIQDFLLREISGASRQLYRQVHTLAWYYHWSEAEILSLPLQKRHIYLDLLSDLVSEFEGAAA
jgi:hypothetical protein